MALTITPPRETASFDEEALFKEARRRRRRRYILFSAAVALALVVGVGLVLAFRAERSSHARHPRAQLSSKSASPAGESSVLPEHPYAMTVSAGGALYLVDTGRDEVLRRTKGRFQVVAGDGHLGFSGDGGPATKAGIFVQTSSGIAVARNGTVYFADTGNNRVREILPDGTIETVIGGGTVPMGLNPEPGVGVDLTDPAGLTIGPDHDLYVAAGPVYRLDDSGMLHWVVGEPGASTGEGLGSAADPPMQQELSTSSRLAFDHNGDLLVAGGGGWGLYEQTPAGAVSYLENFRGDGFWGSLATDPQGNVVLASGFGLARFDPSGGIRGIAAPDLSRELDTGRSQNKNLFIGGDGAAVAPDGTIYVDTNTGNTFTSVSAILAITPRGTVSAVWRS